MNTSIEGSHSPATIEPDDVEGTDRGLFDGDTGDAAAGARTVITHLVRNRVLLGRDHPELWGMLLEHETSVVRHFHNMFVDLIVNRPLQVAYKQQIQPAGVPYSVTVRAATLNLEASVIALYAREQIAAAVPGETVVISRADLRAELEPYWPAQVSNKAAKERKLNAALDSLVTQDLLIKKDEGLWEVSPAVGLVLSAQTIQRFTDLLTTPDQAVRPTIGLVRDADDPDQDEQDQAGEDE